MKLSKADRKILDLIVEAPHGLANYELARSLDKHPTNIHRRLQKLCIHGILKRFEGTPVIYKINREEKAQLTFFIIQCPKCHTEMKTHYEQTTKVCDNEDCLTKSGNRTRFYVNNSRIVRSEKIL